MDTHCSLSKREKNVRTPQESGHSMRAITQSDGPGITPTRTDFLGCRNSAACKKHPARGDKRRLLNSALHTPERFDGGGIGSNLTYPKNKELLEKIGVFFIGEDLLAGNPPEKG